MSPRTSDTPTLPGAPESERWVIGLLLAHPHDTWPEVGPLMPADFTLERYRILFATLCSLRDAGQPTEYSVLLTTLKTEGHLATVGGLTELQDLLFGTPPSPHAAWHVARIRDAAKQRRMQELAYSLSVSLGNGSSAGILARLNAEAETQATGSSLTPIDLSTDPEPVKWLVRGIIPAGGSTIIAAASNTGKSWMALDLALCVALGVDFLGQPDFTIAANDGPVIVVEEESPPGAIHWRLAALLRGHGIDPKDPALTDRIFAYASQGIRPSNRLAWGDLVSQVKRLKPCLVTLDPASSMLDGPDTDPEFVAPLLAAVRALRRLGTAVLIVHHAGWNEPGRVRGWSGWRDSCDTELNLITGTTPNTPTLKWSKVRDGRRPVPVDLHLLYDETRHSMTLEIASRHEQPTPSGQDLDLALWAFVRGRPSSRCDRSDLVAWGSQNGASQRTTDRAIARLKEAAKLTLTDGVYEAKS